MATVAHPTIARAGARAIVALAALLGLAAAGCDDRPARPEPAPPGKRAVYGDPVLVPTRAGELARRELALAGELTHLLREDPRLLLVRVHVALAPGGSACAGVLPGRVVVVGRLREPLEPAALAALEADIGTTAAALVEPLDLRVVVHAPAAPGPDRRGRPWSGLLALAGLLLGAGFALGVWFERIDRRLRPRADAGRR